MSIQKMFSTDDSFESEGIWIDYGNEKVRILRAGARNQKYKQIFSSLMKPYETQMANDNLPEEVGQRIMQTSYAKAIVIDWCCRKDENSPWKSGHMFLDGKEVPATEENIIEIFKKVPDFFVDIRRKSEKLSLFQKAETDKKAKN